MMSNEATLGTITHQTQFAERTQTSTHIRLKISDFNNPSDKEKRETIWEIYVVRQYIYIYGSKQLRISLYKN